MAEVLATMVVGPLVSMVKEKASSYLLDQYKVMEGMEEQHKLLKRKLPAVLDVITDAEEQAAKNREGAKAWLEELRNVAYKANDVLDEFKYEALRRKAKADGHYKEFGMDVIKLFPSHNRFVFRYRMANKLRMILQEIDVLIAEMNTFRFKFKPQPQISLKWRQTDPNIPDHSVNIASDSRAEEKKKIIDTLCGQGDSVDLVVFPIVGMGGMGKTTLAQLVYNDPDIKKHFQLRFWVCVYENFEVDSLVELIVKEVEKNRNEEEAEKNGIVKEAEKNGYEISGGSALEKFKSAVSGKRYLLVLDDIWNREDHKWITLRSYLDHGGTGSSVVTTTRDEYIARLMGTIESHKIKGLKESFIKKIIETRAFSSQAQRPNDDPLKRMVGDAAKRCSGSPLAATALGSVLRTKNTVQEWKAVLNRSTICDEENRILPILKLSYNCLPPHMRQCFAFCAVFPKDHEIDVEMLIRLWMANCFIPEQQGVCLEVTGKQIFNELAERSFFQEVQQDKLYRQITCKIHDLMHDVAQDSMGKECATIDRKLSQSGDFPYSTRHLFLSLDILGNVVNASQEKGSLAIQTLIYDRFTTPDVQHLSKYYRSLRALKTRQGLFLEPKYLHHLRYLDLSKSDIKELPENITILYHLQTLNLSNCHKLEQLPKAMKYMTALRHLYTHGCGQLKSMPPNLGHLTSLQTLTCFVACNGSGCSNVGELEKLDDLGGKLELIQLENASGADAKAANLRYKERLKELFLRWTWRVDPDKEAAKEVLEGLEPHGGLKALRIYEYGGSGIPTWGLKFQGMVELELYGCRNLENLPMVLWQLQSLKFLSLRHLHNLRCLFSGGAPSKFQKLQDVIFPQLEKLEICYCPCLITFPEAPKLSILKLQKCGEEASLQATSRYITSLSSLSLSLSPHSTDSNKEENWIQVAVGDHESPLRDLKLYECGIFFSDDSTLALWKCFGQLSQLEINNCDALVDWPENLFQFLVSLMTLRISWCSNLTGGHAQSALVQQRRGTLPRLEYLEIESCKSLVQVPNLSASLKRLRIGWCDSLKSVSNHYCFFPCLESLEIIKCKGLTEVANLSPSIKTLEIRWCHSLKSVVFGKQQEDTRLPAGTSSSLIAAGSSSEEATVSTALVRKLSTSASSNHYCFFPRLESLQINSCEGLTEVANLPPSIKTLEIGWCDSLVSLLGEVPSLGKLRIMYCARLQSLPNGHHQAYSSLSSLEITGCSGIKQLPPSLQQSLGHLNEKYLDRHLQEPVPAEPVTAEPVPTGRIAALVSKLECFRSRSED